MVQADLQRGQTARVSLKAKLQNEVEKRLPIDTK